MKKKPAAELPHLPPSHRLRLPTFTPVAGIRPFGHVLLLLMAALTVAFAEQGSAKLLAQWRWVDILGEGGMACMVGVWLAYVRASRPAGSVTNWLCLGLGSMLLGGFVDLLDEFWMLPKAVYWDNALESSLMPLGMVLLTFGLHHWRQEQLAVNRQLGQRERFFRDHRRIDSLTQLADAGYLAEQIALERREGRSSSLIMLGWQGFDAVARRHGLAESDRMVQAASLLLQLHLGQDALLCRYGGDRLVALLPGCSGAPAQAHQQRLHTALAGWAPVLASGEALSLPVHSASASTDEALAPQALLLQLLARMH
ncbi:GGDEF domain-containing protein [Pelomonas sp. HMWF004]|nr:GGDEF domain-containing protein [Pelomonas sp. HMWF004]